jgi:hypothetical protein
MVAHYSSEDNELEHAVLALKEIQGAYNRENVALVVLEVLKE